MIQTDLQLIKTLLNEFDKMNQINKINNNKSYFIMTYEIENVLYSLFKKYQLNSIMLEELNYYKNKYRLMKHSHLKTILKKVN